ncbi:hypothetical protein RJ639_030026, partial [Escallonia herrerae]
MGWLLEASGWELTEFDQEDGSRNLNLAALTASGSLEGQKNNGGFSVDLGLGRFADIGDRTLSKSKEKTGSAMSSSPSESSKRTRALGATQHAPCLVEGCTSDLSNCREYHRRHRVCERHSKTPVVIVGGREQRFCQQCSRFHSLVEFDEVKRSCRKRLDGHNRRRRKPQPASLYMSSRSLLSNHKGARLLQFGDPQAYATSTDYGSNLTWPSIDKHQRQLHVTVHQNTSSNSFARTYSERNKQFPILLANCPDFGNQANPEVSISPFLKTNASTQSSGNNLKKSSDAFTHLVESKRALSLLSTQPTQTSGTSLSNLVQQNTIYLNQPTGSSLQLNGLAQYSHPQLMDEKPTGAVLVPVGNTNNYANGALK